jgi:hypothetical protein
VWRLCMCGVCVCGVCVVHENVRVLHNTKQYYNASLWSDMSVPRSFERRYHSRHHTVVDRWGKTALVKI